MALKPKSQLLEALKNPQHRDFYCHDCAWCDEYIDLKLCTKCQGRLSCRRCRNGTTLCVNCNYFDLPPEVQIVGKDDPCDLEFQVQTWREVCLAYHWYVDALEPYDKYGRIDFTDWVRRINLRTEKHHLTASYIRRILKLMIEKYKPVIKRRKLGKLFIRINESDTRALLMKAQLSRPLDGD